MAASDRDTEPARPPGPPIRLYVLHVVLTLVWVLVTGAFSLINLIIGYVLAWVALWVPRQLWGETRYFGHFGAIVRLVGTFLYELVESTLSVLRLVYTPGLPFRSGIIAVPLDVRDDVEVMLFANLISLTPGTLSLDVSDDRRTLYVHAMALEGDADAQKRDLKRTFETRIREATQ